MTYLIVIFILIEITIAVILTFFYNKLKIRTKNFHHLKNKFYAEKKDIAIRIKNAQSRLIEREHVLKNGTKSLKEEKEKIHEMINLIKKKVDKLKYWQSQLAQEKKYIEKQQTQLKKQEAKIKEDLNKNEEQKREIENKRNEIKLKVNEISNFFKKENKKLQARKNQLVQELKQIKKERETIAKEKFQLEKREREINEKKKSTNKVTIPTENFHKNRLIPELICSKKGQTWHLGIKFLGNLSNFSNIQVIQNDIPIPADDDKNYKIEKHAPILIKWNDTGQQKKKRFDIFNKNKNQILIFKNYSQGKNLGRYVRQISYGSYCVIVPETWQRDVELSGDAPIEPEYLSISGYKVHFFFLNKYSGFIIAFIKPDSEKLSKSPKNSRFDLLGNIIDDYQEEQGPLFGDELPKIYDNLLWENVEEIIIGEGGEEKTRPLWAIKPEIDVVEIDLNQIQKIKTDIIEKCKRSNFFIQIYGRNNNLIQRLDFRYIKGLKKIKIAERSIIPEKNGHKPECINFIHDKSCVISTLNEKIDIKSTSNGTEAIIPADPSMNLTKWEIKDSTGKTMEIELLVERIWWNLYNEKEPIVPNEWNDKVIVLSEDDFQANSHSAISIWFPTAGWLRNCFIGFKEEKRRSIRVSRSKRNINIPLRDFCDSEKIISQDSKLKLWLEINNIEKEIPLVAIDFKKKPQPINTPPPPPVDINKDPCCNNCDHARIQFGSIWCRRSNWPQQRDMEAFMEKIASYKCGEWRGEIDDE